MSGECRPCAASALPGPRYAYEWATDEQGLEQPAEFDSLDEAKAHQASMVDQGHAPGVLRQRRILYPD